MCIQLKWNKKDELCQKRVLVRKKLEEIVKVDHSRKYFVQYSCHSRNERLASRKFSEIFFNLQNSI